MLHYAFSIQIWNFHNLKLILKILKTKNAKGGLMENAGTYCRVKVPNFLDSLNFIKYEQTFFTVLLSLILVNLRIF